MWLFFFFFPSRTSVELRSWGAWIYLLQWSNVGGNLLYVCLWVGFASLCLISVSPFYRKGYFFPLPGLFKKSLLQWIRRSVIGTWPHMAPFNFIVIIVINVLSTNNVLSVETDLIRSTGFWNRFSMNGHPFLFRSEVASQMVLWKMIEYLSSSY